MDERVLRFRVGVVVLAAAVITCILIMLLGEGQAIFQRRYTIYLQFPQAPGVTIDTPVRKHGVLIGRVSEVKLLEKGGVLLTVWIDSRYTLRRSEVPRISTSSLLGDAVVEFVPRGEPQTSTRRRSTITPVALSEPAASNELDSGRRSVGRRHRRERPAQSADESGKEHAGHHRLDGHGGRRGGPVGAQPE